MSREGALWIGGVSRDKLGVGHIGDVGKSGEQPVALKKGGGSLLSSLGSKGFSRPGEEFL